MTFSVLKVPEKLTVAFDLENHTCVFFKDTYMKNYLAEIWTQTTIRKELQKLRNKMEIFFFFLLEAKEREKKAQLSSQLPSNSEITEPAEQSSSLVLIVLSQPLWGLREPQWDKDRKICQGKKGGQDKPPVPEGQTLASSLPQPCVWKTLSWLGQQNHHCYTPGWLAMTGQRQEKQISFPLAVASTWGVSFDCPQLSMNGVKAVNSTRFLGPCFSTQISSALSTEELLCTGLTKQAPHIFESWSTNFSGISGTWEDEV